MCCLLPKKYVYICQVLSVESLCVLSQRKRLDGLNLEVEADQGDDEAFEILNKVVESAEALWVPVVEGGEETRQVNAT